MQVAPEKDYLTTRRVAEILLLDETTVRALARQGKFPNAYRPGRSWLIPRADLEGYIKENNQ